MFLKYAEGHYRKNGNETSELSVIKSVIRPLNEMYGMTPAKDFGPLAMKAVRAKMVEFGWVRNTINTGMTRIRRIFKHAVSNELIDSGILQRLQTVAPLLKGRTEARNNAPGTFVDDATNVREQVGLEHTQAVLGHANADMTRHYAKLSNAKAAEVARKIG